MLKKKSKNIEDKCDFTQVGAFTKGKEDDKEKYLRTLKTSTRRILKVYRGEHIPTPKNILKTQYIISFLSFMCVPTYSILGDILGDILQGSGMVLRNKCPDFP